MTPFPPAFESRMRAHLGAAWESFAASHATESPASIRLHPSKFCTLAGQPIPWAAQGRYLSERPSYTLDPTFHAGAYYVQDASSMFLEQALFQSVDLKRRLRVLDLCAAPGGKSTHLLSLLSSDSLLVSNEVIRSRATILSENIQKWGYPNVVVTGNDPNDFNRLPGFFDVMVVDAPCSGEGLFRKDPDAMTEWSGDQVALCAQRQRRIVSDVWSALKQDGILIYCTCTYNEEENEDNLVWLHESKAAESVRLNVPAAWGVEETCKGTVWGYRFFPHRLGGEGFFLAVVRKTSAEPEVNTKVKHHLVSPPQKVVSQLNEWIREPYRVKWAMHDDLVVMVPAQNSADMEFLREKLRVITKGTAVATAKHEKLVPEHALAMSVALEKEHFTKLDLNKEQALSYLRKESLRNDENQRGYALVMYDGLPLGWVNLILGRANNLYPPAWRVRM